MNLPKIETLLLQEMVEVRGGLAGVCECTKGAGQASEDGGKCSCLIRKIQTLVVL